MKTFDSHVCIVSNEPLPNLIPAISAEIGRETIILLVSSSMQEKANALEAALKKAGRTVIRYPIDEKSNLALFRSQIRQVLAQHPDAALNATGGLKTMSLVAHEVFRSADRPVFYSERDNRLIWLHPIEAEQQRLPGLIGIADYFAAFGQTVKSIHREPLASDGGEAMLDKLHTLPKAGKGDQERVGERFESLVFRAARKALAALPTSGIQEAAWGVKTAGEIEDEFDVVIVRNNTLSLIECKNSSRTDEFNTFLNKLDNLRRKRGITARAALITTAHVAKDGGYTKRAAENHIALLDDTDLPGLTSKLTLWLGVR